MLRGPHREASIPMLRFIVSAMVVVSARDVVRAGTGSIGFQTSILLRVFEQR